jgi:hypothetical protein
MSDSLCRELEDAIPSSSRSEMLFRLFAVSCSSDTSRMGFKHWRLLLVLLLQNHRLSFWCAEYILHSKDLKAQDNHHHQHNTTLNNGYNSITVLVQKASTTNGSHTATTHRHVLNLRNLAQNLDVPQLQEVEISLLLQALVALFPVPSPEPECSRNEEQH